MNIRLLDKEISVIKGTVREVFGEDAKVFLFGSRADVNRKGGDIDLLVESDKGEDDLFNGKIKALAKLHISIGERKIDLITTRSMETDKRTVEPYYGDDRDRFAVSISDWL